MDSTEQPMSNEGSNVLPAALLRYLPDSELQVISWDAPEGVLSLRLTKEIGPESGIIRFTGVTRVNLPQRLDIRGIEGGTPQALRDRLPRDADADEVVYLIHGSWGEEFFLVGHGISYSIQQA